MLRLLEEQRLEQSLGFLVELQLWLKIVRLGVCVNENSTISIKKSENEGEESNLRCVVTTQNTQRLTSDIKSTPKRVLRLKKPILTSRGIRLRIRQP